MSSEFDGILFIIAIITGIICLIAREALEAVVDSIFEWIEGKFSESLDEHKKKRDNVEDRK